MSEVALLRAFDETCFFVRLLWGSVLDLWVCRCSSVGRAFAS
jgi:hypothetical protein